MTYQQQLEALAHHHGMQVSYYENCVTVVGPDYLHALPYFNTRDYNLLLAQASIRQRMGDWEAVVFRTMDNDTVRQWGTLYRLPNFTGLVRVFTDGQPASTWYTKNGWLARQLPEW